MSAIPLIPKLVMAAGQEPKLPMLVLQAVSMIQSSTLLFAMVLLGAWLSPKVNLGASILDAYLDKSWDNVNLKKIIVSAVIGGLLGGIAIILFNQLSLPYLPEGFLKNVEEFTPPIYTKMLYGGITKEVIIRWGLMSFFVLGLYRCTQSHDSQVRSYNYVIGIFLAAIIFGVGHLPAAKMLSNVVTVELIAYKIVGNSIFGLIAGFLYWRRGLECAILAHMFVHVVIMIGERLA